MLKVTRRLSFLVVIAAVLVAAPLLAMACGGGNEETKTTPAAASPAATTAAVRSPTASPAAAKPAVKIVAPTPGAAISGHDVTVTVEVTNLKVVDKLSQPAVAGEGHVHFYRDVDTLPTTPGQPAITADNTTYHASATTSYTWKDVASGRHTFSVQLVNNDHTPLQPPVTAAVTVTVP